MSGVVVTVKRGPKIWLRTPGPQGPAGTGIPAGGTTGQVAAKASGSDYDIIWVDAGSGDMAKLRYDPDDDGKVTSAETADAVPWSGVTSKPATFPPDSHTHAIAGVTGLQAALDGKSATGHGHAIADVSGLQTALDGKSATGHTHSIANVTGLQTALDGKSATGHGHAIADVSGLQTALDGKSATGHGHAIADVSGLQTALDGKSATGHTHTLAQVTDAGNAASRNVGSSAGTVCAGDDARLSDARTPTSHTHPAAAISDSTPAGRTLLTAADAAAQRSALGLGTAATTAATDYAPRQRYQTLWIPAGAMVPATTAGAATATRETTTNKQNYDVFAFDGATAESVWFAVRMPDLWDRGTLKAVFAWTPDTSGTGAVVWGLCAGATSDDDAIDAAPGTEVTVADSVIAVGDLHVSAASAALTVGGIPALGDVCFFKVRRIPADAGDTMTQDALLVGVTLQWRESATEASAW